jgi:tetratricopeptide (TPR) repeat protein
MPRPLAAAAAFTLLMSQTAFAVGGFDEEPPTPTQTTEDCAEGQVWDEDAGACVQIEDSALNEGALMRAARELAYADRLDDAIALLGMSATPEDTMVLTYLGFSHRKAGRMAVGMGYYDRALAANPDNILARAYMGMAYVQTAQIDLAEAQLAEIRSRGGVGTWPEQALQAAIAAGDADGYDY